jgi:hypothetical protein
MPKMWICLQIGSDNEGRNSLIMERYKVRLPTNQKAPHIFTSLKEVEKWMRKRNAGCLLNVKMIK